MVLGTIIFYPICVSAAWPSSANDRLLGQERKGLHKMILFHLVIHVFFFVKRNGVKIPKLHVRDCRVVKKQSKSPTVRFEELTVNAAETKTAVVRKIVFCSF